MKINKIKTSLVKCKTIRMKNGGALSSRNILLDKESLTIMGKVFSFLKNYKKDLTKTDFCINHVKSNLKKIGVKKVEYVQLIDLINFKTIKRSGSIKNIFIAYYLNGVRLIDNF